MPSNGGSPSLSRRAVGEVPSVVEKLGPSALSKIQTLARRAFVSISRLVPIIKKNGASFGRDGGVSLIRRLTDVSKSRITQPVNDGANLALRGEAMLAHRLAGSSLPSGTLLSNLGISIPEEGTLRDLRTAGTELAGVVGEEVAEQLLKRICRKATLLWTEKGRKKFIRSWGGKLVGGIGRAQISVPNNAIAGVESAAGGGLIEAQSISEPSTSPSADGINGSIKQSLDSDAAGETGGQGDAYNHDAARYGASMEEMAGNERVSDGSTIRWRSSDSRAFQRSSLNEDKRAELHWKLRHLNERVQRGERRHLLEGITELLSVDNDVALEAVLDTRMLPSEQAYLDRIASGTGVGIETAAKNEIQRQSLARATIEQADWPEIYA
ncbi:hypothetical protein FRB94_007089 [Tulasnella sp. JGI-2019a]|nr:hypothetical protein FRB94_007089 [Tulasnella sp. JGI-2019a]